jgi:hypothetical protein
MESITSNISNAVYIVAAILLIGLGVWIGLTSRSSVKSSLSQDSPKNTSETVTPFSGSSASPAPAPAPPPPTPTPPMPPTKPFTPSLQLLQATLTPAKEIKVDYIVNADTPVPVTKTYSVNFTVEINNKPLTDISEDDPLNQGDVGFKKQALLEVTGLESKTQNSAFVVKAQIHYYSEGKYGTVGTPKTITVS